MWYATEPLGVEKQRVGSFLFVIVHGPKGKTFQSIGTIM